MNAVPLLLYVLAAVAYVAHFSMRHPRVGQAATALLATAAIAHTFLIGMETMALGHVPFAGTTGAVSVFVWLLSLAYLYTEMTTDERAMGVFVVPLVAALQVLPTVMYRVRELPVILHSVWFSLHVTTLLFAYASFALACVIGITYVLLFHELKRKRLGFFSARLPSLDSLDRMNLRAVTVGWVFLTVGVLAGAFWAARVLPGASDPRLQAMSIADPKIFVAILCWVVYSFELYARRAIGWRGRRAAVLSAIGFAIVLLNFVPVGYFLTRSHNFS